MKTKRKKKTKKVVATKRVKKMPAPKLKPNLMGFPCRIFVHDPERVLRKNKPEKEIKNDQIIRFEINNNFYRVKVNKRNQCLEFDVMGGSVYLQPVGTNCFLVKSSKQKEK